MSAVEITKDDADRLLKEKYGFYGDKNFKGSYNGGKYVANKKNKYYECSKLSEAAKALGLI